MSAQRQDWVWIESALIHAVHDEQLTEHGGGVGVRDPNLLESALARPQQLAHYGSPDAADLAASYGYGISRNHPFIDGNKRVALLAMVTFLGLNGVALAVSNAEIAAAILALAAGEVDEDGLTRWIRDNWPKDAPA